MSSMLKSVALAGALGFVMSGTALAAEGLLIVQTTTMGGAPQTNQVQIEGKRMRAESTAANGGKQIVMFDSTTQVLTMVDMAKKTYSEMTQADADALGNQLSAALANLPPQQRAQMEAMMKGRGMGGAAAAPKIQYRKTGTSKVGKWTCDLYEGVEGDKKVSEVCTVDPKALGFTAGDFEVTKQLAAFFKKILPQMSGQMFSIGNPEEQGYSGVPVRQTSTVAGREVVTEVSDVSRQTFPDSTFKVPEGFQKTSMMGLGPGRGRQ
jgi:hypothetical protein